jgi:hypothetical protein
VVGFAPARCKEKTGGILPNLTAAPNPITSLSCSHTKIQMMREHILQRAQLITAAHLLLT